MNKGIFIGSSSKSRHIARAISDNLKQHYKVTPWEDSFVLSRSNMDSLLSIVENHDYGIFIFADDDKIVSKTKGKTRKIPRDNVIFEAGLFTGKHGMDHCFIVAPDNLPDEQKLPTDLAGIKIAYYNSKDVRNEHYDVAVNNAVQEIKRAITLNDRRGEKTNRISKAINGLWLSRFKFSSSKKPNYGTQYNIELIETSDGIKLIGRNLIAWNTITGRCYRHQLEGKILGCFIMGSWENTGSLNVGSFQLAINGPLTAMKGQWLGSDSANCIHNDTWEWKKIDATLNDLNIQAQGATCYPAKDLVYHLEQLFSSSDELISKSEAVTLVKQI